MSQGLKQLSPAHENVEPRGETNVLFVYTGSFVMGSRASVSSVGAPNDLNEIARGIVTEFGEALDRLAE